MRKKINVDKQNKQQLWNAKKQATFNSYNAKAFNSSASGKEA